MTISDFADYLNRNNRHGFLGEVFDTNLLVHSILGDMVEHKQICISYETKKKDRTYRYKIVSNDEEDYSELSRRYDKRTMYYLQHCYKVSTRLSKNGALYITFTDNK